MGPYVVGTLLMTSGLSCHWGRKPAGIASVSRDVDALYTLGQPFPFHWDGVVPGPPGGRRTDRNATAAAVLRLGETLKDDPAWMRLRARLAMIQGDSNSAIRLYTRARLLSGRSSGIATELAAAYALRAEHERRDVDFEPALEYAARAVEEQPGSPAAKFNLALIAERIALRKLAFTEWREAVALQQDPFWRAEARNRMTALERRLKQRREQTAQLQSPLPVPTALLALPGALEVRQQQALRAWIRLPSPPREEMEKIASAFRDRGDQWWTGFLHSPNNPEALRWLSETIDANSRGNYALAERTGAKAEATFSKLGNDAGRLWARRERIQASHRGDNVRACEPLLRGFSRDAESRSYAWLAAQSRLDDITCRTIELEGASATMRYQAFDRIAKSGFEGVTLRALAFLTEPWIAADNPLQLWNRARSGLGRFAGSVLPGYRGYHFCWNLSESAAVMGAPNASRMLLREAVLNLEDDDNPGVRATALSDLAAAEARAGLHREASQDLDAAQRAMEQASGDTAARYRIEIEIERANSEVLNGRTQTALDLFGQLAGRHPAGISAMDRADLLNGYGLALLKAGRFREAERRFRELMALNAPVLRTRADSVERSSVTRRFDAAGRGLVEALLQSGGDPAVALRAWISLQNGRLPPAMAADPVPDVRPRLTYAFLPGGVSAWLAQGSHVEQHWLNAADVQDAAERLTRLAPDEDAAVTAIADAAAQAGRVLLSPFARRLANAGGTLVIDADGPLSQLPWAVVRAPDGRALIDCYPLLQTFGAARAPEGPVRVPLTANSRTAIFADPAIAADLGVPRLSDALEEGRRVAGRFRQAMLISGEAATGGRFRREAGNADIVHFAGHGVSNGGFGALLVAGSPAYVTAEQISALDLSRVRLVVLASCSSGIGSETRSVTADVLVRSFLDAGARMVVAASWPVHSPAAGALSDRLYDALLKGTPPAESLRRAMLDLRTDPATSHPSAWSAFRIYGTL